MKSTHPVNGDAQLCSPVKLLEMVKSGDIQALDRMTRCFGERLISVGRRRCRNEEEAQDAVQDALLSAGTNLTSFRGDGSLEGWLVRMVANACHRMRRGRKNDPSLHDVDVQLVNNDSPEIAAAQNELSQAIGRALMRLPPKDRLVLLLAEGEGWTGPEIAREMNTSPGAIRTKLTRIRTKLRSEMADLKRDILEERQ